MTETVKTTNPDSGPVGIGGWLLLPMLGLFATPLVGLLESGDFLNIAEGWPYLNAMQRLLLVGELAFNVVLTLIAPILLLVLMFKWREEFPAWYAIWAAAVPLFLIADALLVRAAFRELHPGGVSDAFQKETVRAIMRATVNAAIWIPYMMYSERVHNTFNK